MSSRLERRILEALRPVSESVWKPFNTAVAATKRRPKSVVAWIGAEMEFALSQAVASGDAFEHRPSECGHCVQNFLADLDFP